MATLADSVALTQPLAGSLHPAAAATTALSPTDEAAQTAALQTLSGGWVEAAIETANTIFAKPEYSATDWQIFFTNYFRTNPLNNHLWNYLWIRVYDPWLGTEVNTKLQTALKQPLRALAEQVITELDSLGPATWDAALTTNITKRESLFNSLKQSLELAKRTGNATERNQYYTWLKGLINRYPTYFKQPADLGNYYILANLRLFLTVGLVVISPEPLTATRKNDIAATAGLTSRYLTIWNRHQVIIGDNNRTTTPNLITMEAYLSKLPPGYHNLQLITVGDDFDRTDSANFGPLGGFGAVGRAVNIWVSTNPYSQWPLNEVPAHNSIDTLHLMAHEVGHRVDPDYVNLRPTLQARRQVLLQMAGRNDLNYIFPNISWVFDAPQEFLAYSIELYGTYSINALRLGMRRLQVNGTPQPLNQFLFLAEIYAQGGNSVPFYDGTAEGKVIRYDVPVARDQYGHLNQLTVDGQQFDFVLDADGNVQSATATPLPKLTGSVIGTTGSSGNSGNTRAKCFDGDPNSFFDAPRERAWCGLALSSAQAVNYVRFVARADYRDRMIGGRFQGSDVANFSSGVVTLHTITTKPHEGWNWVPLPNARSFRYLRYLSPTGGWGNVSEIEFYNNGVIASALTDGESAVVEVGDHPVDDPGASEPDALAPAGANRLFLPLVVQMNNQ